MKNTEKHTKGANAELLKALKTALNILECKNGYHKKHDNPISIRNIKEAIKKATK